MGLIKITTAGSFGENEMTFTAQQKGHAHAVNKASLWLNELMRQSINKDHKLQKEGCEPDEGFEV